MSKPFIIEELPHDPGFEPLFPQAYRNLMWFSEHANELGVFKSIADATSPPQAESCLSRIAAKKSLRQVHRQGHAGA